MLCLALDHHHLVQRPPDRSLADFAKLPRSRSAGTPKHWDGID
jgi:hypothetical protein